MQLEFDNTQFALAVFGVVALLAVIILGLRMLMKKSSETDLTAKQHDNLASRTKYPEVDAFKYSGTMLGVGIAATLAIVLFAFNWTEYEKEIFIPEYDLEVEEEIEQIPPRTTEPPPPPPPPPPPKIEEVPDEEIEEEDQDLFKDQTITEETTMDDTPVEQVEEAPPPPPPPPPAPEVEEIFKVVEQMPRFPGCEDIADEAEKKQCAQKKLLEFIYENIKYPAIARENGVEGMVVVSFVVEGNGSISAPEVVRDIGAGCGDEALRVVKLMNELNKKWIPGRQRGRPVRVQFNLPVKFQLQ
jgi:protein TonB